MHCIGVLSTVFSLSHWQRVGDGSDSCYRQIAFSFQLACPVSLPCHISASSFAAFPTVPVIDSFTWSFVCCQLLYLSFYAAVFHLQDLNPEGGGQTPGPAQDRGACRPSWGRPHRPRHVQVGLTIVFVLAAGNEVSR
jgi:hypothetical protein